MKEEILWKESKDYPTYFVSNTGLMRNKEGKILSLKSLIMGYSSVSPCYNGKAKKAYIHRIVAKEFCEGFEEHKQVNHKDGNKLNNKVENLEWVTHKENAHHAVRTGLKKYKKGVKYARRKANSNHRL